MSAALDAWIERQYRHSAQAMLRGISAVDVVKTRPGFGQSIRPRPGSVVASVVPASYDPDPDYFFHWFRDSSVIIDALRLTYEDGTVPRERALRDFADFVGFSLAIRSLDGRKLVEQPEWRRHVRPDFEKFVRPDAELSLVHGASVYGETRVNPDGTLDISSWPRPQNDGMATRALTLLRWLRAAGPFEPALAPQVSELLRFDLDYVLDRWQQPCYDIWEEEKGLHYYTLCACAAALEEGSDWLQEQGDGERVQRCHEESQAIRGKLDHYWSEADGYYRSRVLESGARSTKELDISVVFAAIHAPLHGPFHNAADPRMLATLGRLEELFAAAYPINRQRPRGKGPAMGRYQGDVYYSGGAYYFSTLAAAELCYRAAAGQPRLRELVAQGDAFLETVRAFTPESGDLSEQFDQKSGAQTSAKHLTWSYAALVSCIHARRAIS